MLYSYSDSIEEYQMSDQDTLFNQGEAQQPEQAAPNVQQQEQVNVQPDHLFSDLLSNIKDESGRQKYQGIEAALQSIPHAQQHISQLEKELADMRVAQQDLQARLQEQATLQDELQRLKQNTGQTNQPQLDEDKIIQRTVSAVTEQQQIAQQQQVEAANAKQVRDKLTEMFGDQAATKFTAKAQELGMSEALLTGLAKSAPMAALAYFNQAVAQPPTPASSTLNYSPQQSERKQSTFSDISTDAGSVDLWSRIHAELTKEN